MYKKYESHFEHWRWEVSEELLKKYGSPHFSRKDAGSALIKAAGEKKSGAKLLVEQGHFIPEGAIWASNEAYPESAIADPIGDVKIWYDWKTGKRKFPYPGRYSPLDLEGQQAKNVSKSVVGVLGEMLTGRYAEAGISLVPIARVINRWPDFIFYNLGKFHFVEAKGTVVDEWPTDVFFHNPGRHLNNLKELFVDAIRQFGADPWVTVWGGFVFIYIDRSREIKFKVVFIELEAPQSRKSVISKTTPDIVPGEFAKRSVASALARIDPTIPGWKIIKRKKRSKRYSKEKGLQTIAEFHSFDDFKKRASEFSRQELGILIETEAPELNEIIPETEKEIDRLISKIAPAEEDYIGRIERTKTLPYTDEDAFILREIGGTVLVTLSISRAEIASYRRAWESDWDQVQKDFIRHGYPFYRAGGSLFGLMPIEKAKNFAREIY